MIRLAPAENPPRSHMGNLQSRERERMGIINPRERNAGFSPAEVSGAGSAA